MYYLKICQLSDIAQSIFPNGVQEAYWDRNIPVTSEFFFGFTDTVLLLPEDYTECFINSNDAPKYGVDLILFETKGNVKYAVLNDAKIIQKGRIIHNI